MIEMEIWGKSMIHQIHGILWGPIMLLVMLAVGGAYTVRSGFFQIRKPGIWLGATAGSFWRNETKTKVSSDHHSVTRWQSACTALAATVGTGNIVGVATALTAGGPGSCLLDVGFCRNWHDDCLCRDESGDPIPLSG